MSSPSTTPPVSHPGIDEARAAWLASDPHKCIALLQNISSIQQSWGERGAAAALYAFASLESGNYDGARERLEKEIAGATNAYGQQQAESTLITLRTMRAAMAPIYSIDRAPVFEQACTQQRPSVARASAHLHHATALSSAAAAAVTATTVVISDHWQQPLSYLQRAEAALRHALADVIATPVTPLALLRPLRGGLVTRVVSAGLPLVIPDSSAGSIIAFCVHTQLLSTCVRLAEMKERARVAHAAASLRIASDVASRYVAECDLCIARLTSRGVFAEAVDKAVLMVADIAKYASEGNVSDAISSQQRLASAQAAALRLFDAAARVATWPSSAALSDIDRMCADSQLALFRLCWHVPEVSSAPSAGCTTSFAVQSAAKPLAEKSSATAAAVADTPRPLSTSSAISTKRSAPSASNKSSRSAPPSPPNSWEPTASSLGHHAEFSEGTEWRDDVRTSLTALLETRFGVMQPAPVRRLLSAATELEAQLRSALPVAIAADDLEAVQWLCAQSARLYGTSDALACALSIATWQDASSVLQLRSTYYDARAATAVAGVTLHERDPAIASLLQQETSNHVSNSAHRAPTTMAQLLLHGRRLRSPLRTMSQLGANSRAVIVQLDGLQLYVASLTTKSSDNPVTAAPSSALGAPTADSIVPSCATARLDAPALQDLLSRSHRLREFSTRAVRLGSDFISAGADGGGTTTSASTSSAALAYGGTAAATLAQNDDPVELALERIIADSEALLGPTLTSCLHGCENQSVILCVPRLLSALPWEALRVFAGAASVSRDFCLHVVGHRIALSRALGSSRPSDDATAAAKTAPAAAISSENDDSSTRTCHASLSATTLLVTVPCATCNEPPVITATATASATATSGSTTTAREVKASSSTTTAKRGGSAAAAAAAAVKAKAAVALVVENATPPVESRLLAGLCHPAAQPASWAGTVGWRQLFKSSSSSSEAPSLPVLSDARCSMGASSSMSSTPRCTGGGFMLLGHGQLPLQHLFTMDAPACRVAILADGSSSAATERASALAAAAAAMASTTGPNSGNSRYLHPDSWERAALLTCIGVGSIIMNQWPASHDANEALCWILTYSTQTDGTAAPTTALPARAKSGTAAPPASDAVGKSDDGAVDSKSRWRRLPDGAPIGEVLRHFSSTATGVAAGAAGATLNGPQQRLKRRTAFNPVLYGDAQIRFEA